jgi:hypothetical protein
MVVVWFVSGIFYYYAAHEGIFAPTNPLVFNNARYVDCRAGKDGTFNAEGRRRWFGCPSLSEEYTTLSPFAYSLDLILPLVDLQQERDWAPMLPATKHGDVTLFGSPAEALESTWRDYIGFSLNHVTRLLMWFEVLFGWAGSLALVAVLSGLVKRLEV